MPLKPFFNVFFFSFRGTLEIRCPDNLFVHQYLIPPLRPQNYKNVIIGGPSLLNAAVSAGEDYFEKSFINSENDIF